MSWFRVSFVLSVKKEKGREIGRKKRQGQECYFTAVLSPQPMKMNKIRDAVSSSIIISNESVFQQMAQFWVSASQRPPLSVSARQLSLEKLILFSETYLKDVFFYIKEKTTF